MFPGKMAPYKSCEICLAAPHKYKCPKCYLKYCSVPCYKKHTELSCKLLPKDNQPIQERLSSESKMSFLIDNKKSARFLPDGSITKSTVLPEKLQLLSQDEEVLHCLQNPHLRNLLQHLNSAEDPAKALHAAMLEPLFDQLADHCLRVVVGKENDIS